MREPFEEARDGVRAEAFRLGTRVRHDDAVASPGHAPRHPEAASSAALTAPAEGSVAPHASLPARVLVPGRASGAPLRIAPVSFWGGLDGQGTIVGAHHPAQGRGITGTVLVLETSHGSSSGSSVLAELIAAGRAPAAIVVAEPDAIIAAGCLAAQEIVEEVPPVVEVAQELLDVIGTAAEVRVDVRGREIGEQDQIRLVR